MKHNWKITILLLSMFVITQVLGLAIVSYYNSPDHDLPFGLEVPDVETGEQAGSLFVSLIFSFVIAVMLFVLLTKLKLKYFLKVWFFIVVMLALGITFNVFFLSIHITPLKLVTMLSLGVGAILAFFKLFKRTFLLHNFTELLIYPGIAVIFVPILNVYTVTILLVLISGYDMWAVWHSKIMQKMVKYQMDELKTFSGFFIPYLSKIARIKLKKIKKTKSKKGLKGIKVNLAILGGGDIVFPIITSGVLLKNFGLGVAVFSILGALLGLAYIYFFAEKGKYYPAMPFITVGIIVGTSIGMLLF